MICHGTETGVCFQQYLDEHFKDVERMPEEIELYVKYSFDIDGVTINDFTTEESYTLRTICNVKRTAIAKMWQNALPDFPMVCKMKVHKYGELDIPEINFKNLGVSDIHMSYEQACVVNPVGSIQLLHNEGYHSDNCWIHSCHADGFRGRELVQCLGCFATYGENWIICTIPPIESIDDSLVSKIYILISENDSVGAIECMNQISDRMFDRARESNYSSDIVVDFMKLSIKYSDIQICDYIIHRFPNVVRVPGNVFMEYIIEYQVNVEMFKYAINSGINITRPGHNYFSCIIRNHYNMVKNDDVEMQPLLRDLIIKVDILVDAGSDPLEKNENNGMSAFDTMALYHDRHNTQKHYGNQVFDVLFNYARRNAVEMEFDANSVFMDNELILRVLRSHHNPIIFLKYMHERQGAMIDYTDSASINALFVISDAICYEYLCNNGVDRLHVNFEGDNVVTYILKFLINDHTKYFQGNLLDYLSLLMLSGVNANNQKQTKKLLKDLMNSYENNESPGPDKQRDIDICNWFESFYNKEFLGIRQVLFRD